MKTSCRASLLWTLLASCGAAPDRPEAPVVRPAAVATVAAADDALPTPTYALTVRGRGFGEDAGRRGMLMFQAGAGTLFGYFTVDAAGGFAVPFVSRLPVATGSLGSVLVFVDVDGDARCGALTVDHQWVLNVEAPPSGGEILLPFETLQTAACGRFPVPPVLAP